MTGAGRRQPPGMSVLGSRGQASRPCLFDCFTTRTWQLAIGGTREPPAPPRKKHSRRGCGGAPEWIAWHVCAKNRKKIGKKCRVPAGASLFLNFLPPLDVVGPRRTCIPESVAIGAVLGRRVNVESGGVKLSQARHVGSSEAPTSGANKRQLVQRRVGPFVSILPAGILDLDILLDPQRAMLLAACGWCALGGCVLCCASDGTKYSKASRGMDKMSACALTGPSGRLMTADPASHPNRMRGSSCCADSQRRDGMQWRR
jgi:hypothetical protein